MLSARILDFTIKLKSLFFALNETNNKKSVYFVIMKMNPPKIRKVGIYVYLNKAATEVLELSWFCWTNCDKKKLKETFAAALQAVILLNLIL